MCEDEDYYRTGALWRHNTSERVVRVCGSSEDTVVFMYLSDTSSSKPYSTSKPLFELFFDKVDPSDEGLFYLSKM